jgi:hypothetical protein
MQLLRRSSSHKESNGKSEEGHRNPRPSLFHRLSRRSSQEHVKETLPSSAAVKPEPEVATTSLKASKPTALPSTDYLAEQQEGDASLANGLSKEDVQALFFGAPHFMLEKGRHGKSFPQAFFPWNNDLEVSDLQDRRYLSHESFALTTLHAHLPIPDEMSWSPSPLPQKREEAWKRPMLDLGIFETPNMLSVHGREPGTVGLRFFLEVPISEKLRTIKKAKEEEKGYAGTLSHMSATEAFKKEASRSQTGKHASRQDRLRLINDGPRAWERLGIRDVKPSTIIDRIAFLCHLHDEVMAHGLSDTILHKQSCAVLHEVLFSSLLYPPADFKDDGIEKHNRVGLKVQIEALVKILTTPGAWIDFSLVEPRIRLGQALWEVPPYDGQSFDTTSLKPGAERKWLLLQILLAMELRVRLDAALRLGSSDAFREFLLSPEEIHHFNKLRNLKVDWDLVVARRFLDLVNVKQASNVDLERLMHGKHAPQSHLASMFKKKIDLNTEDDLSIWTCAILPRRADIQLDGLLRFARMMNWPQVDELEAELTKRYRASSTSQNELYAHPIANTGNDSGAEKAPARAMRSLFSGDDWIESAYVSLRPVNGTELGGFLGRSWLMGLVMPGDAGCLSVMACLLEQDRQASKLGSAAYLHAGFVLNRRSFWSKFCIVGRVLAPAKESTECMGWVNTPQFQPLDDIGETYKDVWLNVTASNPPTRRQGLRIYDGQKLADDSNVLGAGRGKILSSEYSMVSDKVLQGLKIMEIEVNALTVRRKSTSAARENSLSAALTFTSITTENGRSQRELQLAYGVGFVSSHPCRTPHGHVVLPAEQREQHHHPHHQAHEHLPSHPLHNSYNFEPKSVADLIDASPPEASRGLAVWIVDARGSPSKDMFARAWCSQVGNSAVVSRVGQCCLSCSIREAFALEISIIIRVGDRLP